MYGIDVNDLRFRGETDSRTIQNAVDFAEREGITTVIVPRNNDRTGKNIWSIEKTILLPSSLTVILDDCHLRLADGVRENIFRNRNTWTQEGNTLAGEQHDIRIVGVGNAVLDGGEPNGLCEQLHRDHPDQFPHMHVNLLVFFHNVRDFEVRNIHVVRSRWWALCFMFCRWGRISEIDCKMYGTLENQDGIDLRIGCEYITIENITGITGDDTVALTALPRTHDAFQAPLRVEGKRPDIHDITIRNIISSTHGCSLLRFLNTDGAAEYNITVDGLKDTGASISGAAIFMDISTDIFTEKRHHTHEEFRNVVIRNVSTCAQHGLFITGAMQDVLIENVSTYGKCAMGLQFGVNFDCKNVTIQNCSFRSDPETTDCVIHSNRDLLELQDELHFRHVRADRANYIFRVHEAKIEDFVYAEPAKGYFHPDRPDLPSAYGRYHRCAYGREITNRPADNRFSGTLPPPAEDPFAK